MSSRMLESVLQPYPEALLANWKGGDHSMLTDSSASDYIKRIITFKASNRPGGRFFGEAYIASTEDMVDGWYNSFKWLTADKWLTGKGLNEDLERPFHEALMEHVGKDILSNLQDGAKKLFEQHKGLFEEDGAPKRPVAPDLWLVSRTGQLKFIESKLPGDTIGVGQIAGLALIKNAVKDVSVSIVSLYPEGRSCPASADLNCQFLRFHDLA